MRRFAELYAALDRTASTNAKVAALEAYFRDAPPEDAAWTVHVLAGRRLLRLLPTRLLREWTMEITGVAPWLLEESYGAVGDLAETIALLLDGVPPVGDERGVPLHTWIEERLEGLRAKDPDGQRAEVLRWWRGLPTFERFLINKLLTGEMRVGVSQTLVVRALAAVAFLGLLAPDGSADEDSRPYPFCLAYPLEQDVEALGPRAAWQAEWKWDGIRAQVIRRGGQTYLWSRGEEVITARFPEVVAAAAALPDGTVLDGEVLAWEGDAPLPFARLQVRIGRQNLTKQALASAPAAFMAYDLLEEDGTDVRMVRLVERRSWKTRTGWRWGRVGPSHGPAASRATC